MARSIKEIETELLGLAQNERAKIARDLLLSLEESIDGDVEEVWIREVEARYETYRQGKSVMLGIDEAFEEAFKGLK